MRARTGYSMGVWLTAVLLVALAVGCGGKKSTSPGAISTATTVSSVTPANGATDVAINTKLAVTFSIAMNPSTLTAMTTATTETPSIPANFLVTGPGTTPVLGTVTYVGTTATFTPASNLAANTLFTATLTTAVQSQGGNPLASDFVWTFTTGAELNTTNPTVSSTVPANGATGVAINTKLTATFSQAMDPLTITTTTFTVTGPGTTSVSGTVAYVGTGTTAIFTPASDLAANTLFTATITSGARSLAGNALAIESSQPWTFTTGAAADTTAPTVSSTNPANAATGVAINSAVNATFSEAMDPSTITTTTFKLTGPGTTPVSGTVTYNGTSTTATFTPASNLDASTLCTATITTGVKDLAGNALVAGFPWTFTTGTGLAPGAVPLGSTGTFGIMATSAITNTGLSVINGDAGLDPGTSMTGFPPGVVNGTTHVNDAVSAQARIDLLSAYNYATGLAPGTAVPAGADLGALYPSGIPPGTYTSGSTMLVATPLVLDAGGNANAVWVFQIGSSLTTGASVTLANAAQAKNVFWVPTLDATIGGGTTFNGTIVAGGNVTAVTGATINGRILAGAITAGTIALDTNTINVPAP